MRAVAVTGAGAVRAFKVNLGRILSPGVNLNLSLIIIIIELHLHTTGILVENDSI